jgi:transposase
MVVQKDRYVKSALRRMLKKTNDKRLSIRVRIVLISFGNASVGHISNVVGSSESTVRRTLKRFARDSISGLQDKREDNGQEKLSEAFLGMLWTLVENTPPVYGYRRPTWTRELLVKEMNKQTGVRISLGTMSRALAKIHARRGRPRPTVNCPWSKAAKTHRLRQIYTMIASCKTDEIVVYEDEVDIHLNPKIGLDWMNLGQQKEVLTPGQNQKTSDLFLRLLEKLIETYPGCRRIHVILDNYKIHKSKLIEAALRHHLKKIELHFLPPYSPNENRIERVWKDLHDEVTRNHQHPTMDLLMKEVRYFVRQRNRRNKNRVKIAIAA